MKKTINDENDECESYDAMTSDVRSDCTVKLPSGRLLSLLEADFVSPNNEVCYVVMMVKGRRNSEMTCPTCNRQLSKQKPLFLMDNGEFCYPCVYCDDWQWWVENDPWMYWLE